MAALAFISTGRFAKPNALIAISTLMYRNALTNRVGNKPISARLIAWLWNVVAVFFIRCFLEAAHHP